MNIRQAVGHLDQMIRQTRAHHVELSSMADMKANMMLTIASLMIPLSVRYVSEPQFHWAALTMTGFCVLTVILSAYAAMPKVPLRRVPIETADLENPPFNILFFGSFASLGYAGYRQAMEKIMNDPGMTYETQVREIYTMGQYLARKKYRFIQLAYISFITGIVLSSLVYGLNYLS